MRLTQEHVETSCFEMWDAISHIHPNDKDRDCVIKKANETENALRERLRKQEVFDGVADQLLEAIIFKDKSTQKPNIINLLNLLKICQIEEVKEAIKRNYGSWKATVELLRSSNDLAEKCNSVISFLEKENALP